MMLIAKSKLEAPKKAFECWGVELVRAADEYGVIRGDCVEDLACSPLGVFEAVGGRSFRIAGVRLGMVTSDRLSRFAF
jgi:hypothetical protein